MWLLWLLPFLTTVNPQSDVSPCPRFFVYEGKSPEPNRWYGIITLFSDIELHSVWLYVAFDRPILQLGNWFAEPQPISDDNREYLIKNEDYNLKAYTQLPIRFFISYDPIEPKPRLVSFRLNGQVLCPETIEERTTSQAPKLFVSKHKANGTAFINKAKNATSQCGLVVVQPAPLISYGSVTRQGEFPWHTALYQATGMKMEYLCGGSLISKSFVVTAGQCAFQKRTRLPPSDIKAHMGEHDLYKDAVQVQVRSVAEIQVHPSYNPATLKNDIALLKLSAMAEVNEFVRTVCLWTNNQVLHNEGVVPSWGLTETGAFTNELKQATMPIVSHEMCILSNPNFYGRFTSENTYCAGYRNGTSVCNGSSGSGMVLKSGSNWFLRGIVSLAVPLADYTCDPLQYVVFTDVSKYLGWIRESMANEAV